MNPPSKQPGPLRQLFHRLAAPPQGHSGSVPKTNWITLITAFLFSVTLWFVVALNKQDYQSWFTVPVKLVNFPEKYQLTDPFPPSIEVLAQGHGIDLLMNSLRGHTDTIKIDFALYEAKGQFIAMDNLPALTKGLPPHLEAKGATPPIIHLDFELKASRLVPVIENLDVRLQKQSASPGKSACSLIPSWWLAHRTCSTPSADGTPSAR